MIYVGSRYERQDVYFTVDGRSGSTRPTVMRDAVTRPTRRPTQSVKWQEGTRIDAASLRLTGSPDKWWVLMDANPDILDPMSITPGTTVILP